MKTKAKPVELPSEGYFYPEDHPLADGVVNVRHMTAADEDILTDQTLIKKNEAIDRLLENVIVDENVELSEMYNGDVGGVMLATRIMAYGPEYPFEIDCPVCEERNQKAVDLTEIQTKEIPFEQYERNQTEFSMTLPVTGSEVRFRLLTRGDVKKIQTELDRVKRSAQRSGGRQRADGQQVSTNMTTRLRYLIQEIDGERDKPEIRRFVEEMPARDSLSLREKVSDINPDVNLEFEFMCDHCGHAEWTEIPLDESFFFPTR